MTTESKKRTITLTGRAPVTVVEDNWPVIAKGVEENNAYGPGMTPRPEEEVARTTMRVRQHKDGRAIVYVTVKDAGAWCACTPGHAGGKMLAAGSDLALEITRVGALCDVSDEVIRDCIASLPAVEVDEKPQTASDLAALADRYRSVLQDAAEFVRHGTPIHSGSDVAQAILEVLK